MEILFRDKDYIYFVEDISGRIQREEYWELQTGIENIKHLDNIKPICHITIAHKSYDIDNIPISTLTPVYYVNANYAVVADNNRVSIVELNDDVKVDYTLVNLKLLEDGNNI